jgi:hypothetical protein
MSDFIQKIEEDVLEKAEQHDVNVVARKQKDIARHDVQMEHDKSKLLKDLHEKEIEHDENVIERKQEDIGKDEAKLRKDEA